MLDSTFGYLVWFRIRTSRFQIYQISIFHTHVGIGSNLVRFRVGSDPSGSACFCNFRIV